MKESKAYQTLLATVFLVVFPPLGIYFLWKYKSDWSNVLKGGISFWFSVIFLVAVYSFTTELFDSGSVAASILNIQAEEDRIKDGILSADTIVSSSKTVNTVSSYAASSQNKNGSADSAKGNEKQASSTSENISKATTVTQTSSEIHYSSFYVLNTNTKKIHLPWCSSVEKIRDENYAETEDFDAAIADGYKACAICKPEK